MGSRLVVSLPIWRLSLSWEGHSDGSTERWAVPVLPVQVILVHPHRHAALTLSPLEHPEPRAAHGQGTGRGLGAWSRGWLGF